MDANNPRAEDAERAILGAILLANDCFYQTDRLSVEDFYLDSHRRIYGAMCELVEDNLSIDFVTLTQSLEEKRELKFCGGNEYVMSLTDGLPRVKNIEQYIRIVVDKSRRRKFIHTVSNAVAAVYDVDVSIDELIRTTDRNLLEIETNRKSEPKKLADILSEADQEIENDLKVSEERISVGYSFGIPSLDNFTTGIRRREVTIISGWTSHGKSVLLKQSLMANAICGIPSVVFSREISRQRLTLDLKTYVSEVTAKHVRDPRKMDLFEKNKFKEANEVLRHWPVWIDDSREMHIDEVQHRARRLIRQEGVEVVYIDYLGLLRGTGRNATEQMDDICDGIWNLADSENVAVVALAQMSRDDKKENRRPRLQDLKQTSMLEQCGHCVMFVYRPETNGQKSRNDEIVVAKQRHGDTGILPVEFNKDSLKFEERNVKYEDS